MKLLLVCWVIFLTACGANPPKPELVAAAPVVEVRVPVPVPCVNAADIPVVPGSSLPVRTAGVEALANGAAADVLTYRSVALKQNAMLVSCSVLKP